MKIHRLKKNASTENAAKSGSGTNITVRESIGIPAVINGGSPQNVIHSDRLHLPKQELKNSHGVRPNVDVYNSVNELEISDTEIDDSTRIKQAEARTKQAEARTDQAKTRTERANARTEQAKTRTEQAEIRTEQAETRTEQAEMRTEQAETRTEQAKTRTEHAEMRTEQAEARSEEAIRTSELSYRRLFEAAKDGILILEADTGLISDVNPFLIELLGFSHNELVGTPIWELGSFRDIMANKAKFEHLQQQGYVRYENLPLETRDGHRVIVEFVSNEYQVGERNVIQCNVRDITERRRAEEKIQTLNDELEQRSVERRQLETQFIEAQKMEVVGQLASGVAHDFNNILLVIMGYSDLITSELQPDNPMQNNIKEIRHASERAVALTRQLLVFSHKQAVHPIVLDLNDTVNELDLMLRRLIGENIEMIIVTGKQAGRIKADAGYIAQVLMNLVVNARDAMPNGGKITIETNNISFDDHYVSTHKDAIAGDFVMLSVGDTGTGMTMEVQAHLFKPFFTTKPIGKGTGLGLATCQMIVQQSGGYIDVQSEVDKGTILKFYFPRVEQPLDVVTKPIQNEMLLRGTETLLVVEDEPSVMQIARIVLENHGYKVLSASNGQDALRVAGNHSGSPIRLVITDVIMPLMSGKEMADHLKTTYPDIKILFTSGYSNSATSPYGELETGVEFLSKPYSAATLIHKVHELLGNGIVHQ